MQIQAVLEAAADCLSRGIEVQPEIMIPQVITRQELIDRAVSRLYSPNADNALCTLRFRDGKSRTVTARELASGRTFVQICRTARQAAFQRDIRSEDAGLRVADIDDAVVAALERLASTLTPRNVASYLSDLPQDVDVVSVERIPRPVPARRRPRG